MKIIYADMKPEFTQPSIFLAGPTYRKGDIVVDGSFWRKDAIALLEKLGFEGIVFVPEPQTGHDWSYDSQVEWEYECMMDCEVIVFWIPRDLSHLPGYTTNVEFGRFVNDERMIYGRPEGAPKTRYLDWLYTKTVNAFPTNNLAALMHEAANMSEDRWEEVVKRA
jgi:hypothetical protein